MNEEDCMSFVRVEVQVLQYSSMRQEASPASKAVALVTRQIASLCGTDLRPAVDQRSC